MSMTSSSSTWPLETIKQPSNWVSYNNSPTWNVRPFGDDFPY
jgi:hypothetical protein